MQLTEARFLIAAAVLHTAIPALAEIAPERDWGQYILAAGSQKKVSEIDVDISGLPSHETRRYQRPDLDDQPRYMPDHALAMNEPRRYVDPRRLNMPTVPSPTSDPETPPPDQGSTLVSPEPGGPSDYSMPPPKAGYGLPPGALPGLGGTPLWHTPGVIAPDDNGSLPAPTDAPRRKYDRKRATRMLEDGQRAKDKKLGLDFPGKATVIKVVRSAVLGGGVPFPSTASFTVAVSAAGKVTSVTLNSHTGGDSGAWEAVRKQVKAQLATRTFALKTAFKKGATLSVGITAMMKKPGGGTARDGATLSFDVTDIGARAKRHVAVGVYAIPIR